MGATKVFLQLDTKVLKGFSGALRISVFLCISQIWNTILTAAYAIICGTSWSEWSELKEQINHLQASKHIRTARFERGLEALAVLFCVWGCFRRLACSDPVFNTCMRTTRTLRSGRLLQEFQWTRGATMWRCSIHTTPGFPAERGPEHQRAPASVPISTVGPCRTLWKHTCTCISSWFIWTDSLRSTLLLPVISRADQFAALQTLRQETVMHCVPFLSEPVLTFPAGCALLWDSTQTPVSPGGSSLVG